MCQILLNFLIENEIYKDDYEKITARILEEDVNYETAIEAVKRLRHQECSNKVFLVFGRNGS